MKVQLVTDCTDCPFAEDDEGKGGKWHCHAQLTRDGWATPLPVNDRPPLWCPIRGEGRLVVLKKRAS